MGMAHLMGQLGLPSSPEAAVPLLHRAATLASVDVPQPAYVYGLLLLQEFSHISIPPPLFVPFIPSGSTAELEARKQGAVFAYGNFLTVVINFLILAFIIFLMVKGVNELRRRAVREQPVTPPAPPADVALLTEIRDILARRPTV